MPACSKKVRSSPPFSSSSLRHRATAVVAARCRRRSIGSPSVLGRLPLLWLPLWSPFAIEGRHRFQFREGAELDTLSVSRLRHRRWFRPPSLVFLTQTNNSLSAIFP